MLMEPPGSATATVSRPPAQSQSSGASKSPAPPTPDTSPAKAWSDAVAQARANSPQQHVTVKPGDTLTGIANSRHDTLPGVEANNPQISDPNLIHSGDTVYLPKKTPAQVVSGVDNSQIKPIITAMADANLADQNLQTTAQNAARMHVRDPEVFSGAQAQSTNSWNMVQRTTFNMLMNNNQRAYPEQAAAAEVRQLNALEPGNAKFAAANNAALTEATKQWRQMGVTKPELSPIINAYNNAKQIDQDLQNPHLLRSRFIAGQLNAAQQQANTQLNTAIEKSLTQAANQAGKDPQARATAISDRADNIKSFGPNDPAFKTAVDDAKYDLQVNKPAQQVANAYTSGGAQAAAEALKTVTRNAGDPGVARQIIQASQGTIDSITKHLGSQAASSAPTILNGSSAPDAFNQIYADLSQSVNAAATIHVSFAPDGKTSITLGPDGKEAADLVGNSIARNVPKNLMPYQAEFYGAAAANAIANGDGAALTLATAAALKTHGDPRVASSGYGFPSNTNPTDVASYLVDGAATGLQGLQSKTDSDVKAFGGTAANLYQLQTTWTPFMTKSQLANATDGYLADHSDVRQKADAELATISQDGNAIVEAVSASHTYGPQLAGVSGQKDLSTAAQSMGGDNAAAFAVSRSTSLNTAVANALFPVAAKASAGQSSQTWPGWSVIQSARSAASASQKNIKASSTKIFSTFGSSTAHNVVSLGLSVAGLGLTARNAATIGFPFSSPEQAASSIYTALGFGKYAGETLSGAAKFSKIANSKWFPSKIGGIPTDQLTDQPAFKALGVFYYGAGAFAAGAAAVDASNHDWIPTALDSAQALGNAGNALKPLLALASADVAEDVATAASGIGLVATAGSVIWQMVNSARATDAYRSDNTKFLEQGLGLNSGLAQALAGPGGSSPSLVPALQQYARANGMTPGQLLLKLNDVHTARGYPLTNVDQFLYQASRMPMQSNGAFPSSVPGDYGSSQISKIEIFGPNGQGEVVPEPLPAESLNQLNYWAQVLFGNQLG
jgi:LysM domain